MSHYAKETAITEKTVEHIAIIKKWIANHPGATTRQVGELIQRSDSTTRNILVRMEEDGIIFSTAGRKNANLREPTTWEFGSKLIPPIVGRRDWLVEALFGRAQSMVLA